MRYLDIKALAAVCVFAALSASAETEDALYGAPVPEDAIFIRQIGQADGAVSVLGRQFSPGDFHGDAYTAVSARNLSGAEIGRYYTVLSRDGETMLIEEPGREDQGKVHLFLLNSGTTDARLVVAGGGPEVIGAVHQGSIESRAVNPLSVTLSVEADDQSHSFDVVLRRGVNLTFLVEDGEVRLIEHEFGPVIDVE